MKNRQDAPRPAARRLDRREFLSWGTAAGALAATGARAQETPADEQKPAGPGPATTEPAAPRPATPAPSFELAEMTIDDLQKAMASGKLSARRITEHYFERIFYTNLQGPELRAVIETNPEAVPIAIALDEERAEKGPRGPLHGIPVLLKDNVATADRNTTTAGSLALEGSIPPADSFVARRLRAAGAVLLGKANLSEWANIRSNRSSSGWSARGGQCKNPYALDRNPCGSSSGSGAATSANLTAVSIGTETNGSIVCPSSANGLVGVKPTVGLVSRTRIIPISHTQDTAGPMTRTVRDAAYVLGALTGVDPDDPATAASAGHAHADYTRFLDPDGLRGARIGVSRAHFGFDPRVDALMEAALSEMSRRGAVIVDPVEVTTWDALRGKTLPILLYELKAGLNAYFAALGPDAPVKTLADVIAFNERHRALEMPYFGQELFLEAQEKGPLDSKEYLDAVADAHRLTREEGIDKTVTEHELDAIVAPTGGPAWVTDLVNGDHFSGGSSTPAAVAGYPNVTVPAGDVFGLPVGISFFGRAWSEPALLRIAYAYEQATGHRRVPRFLPHADLG